MSSSAPPGPGSKTPPGPGTPAPAPKTPPQSLDEGGKAINKKVREIKADGAIAGYDRLEVFALNYGFNNKGELDPNSPFGKFIHDQQASKDWQALMQGMGEQPVMNTASWGGTGISATTFGSSGATAGSWGSSQTVRMIPDPNDPEKDPAKQRKIAEVVPLTLKTALEDFSKKFEQFLKDKQRGFLASDIAPGSSKWVKHEGEAFEKLKAGFVSVMNTANFSAERKALNDAHQSFQLQAVRHFPNEAKDLSTKIQRQALLLKDIETARAQLLQDQKEVEAGRQTLKVAYEKVREAEFKLNQTPESKAAIEAFEEAKKNLSAEQEKHHGVKSFKKQLEKNKGQFDKAVDKTDKEIKGLKKEHESKMEKRKETVVLRGQNVIAFEELRRRENTQVEELKTTLGNKKIELEHTVPQQKADISDEIRKNTDDLVANEVKIDGYSQPIQAKVAEINVQEDLIKAQIAVIKAQESKPEEALVNEAAKAMLNTLQSRKATFSKELQDLKNAEAKLNNERTTLQKDASTLNGALAKLQAHEAELTVEVAQLPVKIARAKVHIAAADLDEKLERKAELEGKIKNLEALDLVLQPTGLTGSLKAELVKADSDLKALPLELKAAETLKEKEEKECDASVAALPATIPPPEPAESNSFDVLAAKRRKLISTIAILTSDIKTLSENIKLKTEALEQTKQGFTELLALEAKLEPKSSEVPQGPGASLEKMREIQAVMVVRLKEKDEAKKGYDAESAEVKKVEDAINALPAAKRPPTAPTHPEYKVLEQSKAQHENMVARHKAIFESREGQLKQQTSDFHAEYKKYETGMGELKTFHKDQQDAALARVDAAINATQNDIGVIEMEGKNGHLTRKMDASLDDLLKKEKDLEERRAEVAAPKKLDELKNLETEIKTVQATIEGEMKKTPSLLISDDPLSELIEKRQGLEESRVRILKELMSPISGDTQEVQDDLLNKLYPKSRANLLLGPPLMDRLHILQAAEQSRDATRGLAKDIIDRRSPNIETSAEIKQFKDDLLVGKKALGDLAEGKAGARKSVGTGLLGKRDASQDALNKAIEDYHKENQEILTAQATVINALDAKIKALPPTAPELAKLKKAKEELEKPHKEVQEANNKASAAHNFISGIEAAKKKEYEAQIQYAMDVMSSKEEERRRSCLFLNRAIKDKGPSGKYMKLGTKEEADRKQLGTGVHAAQLLTPGAYLGPHGEELYIKENKDKDGKVTGITITSRPSNPANQIRAAMEMGYTAVSMTDMTKEKGWMKNPWRLEREQKKYMKAALNTVLNIKVMDKLPDVGAVNQKIKELQEKLKTQVALNPLRLRTQAKLAKQEAKLARVIEQQKTINGYRNQWFVTRHDETAKGVKRDAKGNIIEEKEEKKQGSIAQLAAKSTSKEGLSLHYVNAKGEMTTINISSDDLKRILPKTFAGRGGEGTVVFENSQEINNLMQAVQSSGEILANGEKIKHDDPRRLAVYKNTNQMRIDASLATFDHQDMFMEQRQNQEISASAFVHLKREDEFVNWASSTRKQMEEQEKEELLKEAAKGDDKVDQVQKAPAQISSGEPAVVPSKITTQPNTTPPTPIDISGGGPPEPEEKRPEEKKQIVVDVSAGDETNVMDEFAQNNQQAAPIADSKGNGNKVFADVKVKPITPIAEREFVAAVTNAANAADKVQAPQVDKVVPVAEQQAASAAVVAQAQAPQQEQNLQTLQEEFKKEIESFDEKLGKREYKNEKDVRPYIGMDALKEHLDKIEAIEKKLDGLLKKQGSNPDLTLNSFKEEIEKYKHNADSPLEDNEKRNDFSP